MLSLKTVQKVDNRTKLLIYGFNRNCRKSLPEDNPYYDIPDIINNICILFYWIKEFFNLHDAGIEILENGSLANKISVHSGWSTVYGDLVLNKPICKNTMIEYEMEINIIPGSGAFGICEVGYEREMFRRLIWNQDSHSVYSLHGGCGPGLSLHGTGCGEQNPADVSSKVHEREDHITMTVNIAGKELIFFSIKQDKELGRFTNIDYSTISYRFGASMTTPGNCIKLLDVRFS